MMRALRRPTLLQVGLASALHLALSVMVFLWSLSASSDAFDGRRVSWLAQHVAGPLTTALWFPAVPVMDLARSHGLQAPPALQWLVLVCNSLLWGALLAGLYAQAKALEWRGPRR